MKLPAAQRTADLLLKLFDPTGTGVVAGSVRRAKPEPGDIELMLPWFDGDDDPVYRAIERHVQPPSCADLFGKQLRNPEHAFSEINGLRPGFKSCRLYPIRLLPGMPTTAFKLDIFRFTPGSLGNFGWQLLIRTGCADFSQACAAHWLRVINRSEGGSRDGFLRDGEGYPIPTPTEKRAFDVLGIAWVPPEERTSVGAVRPLKMGASA